MHKQEITHILERYNTTTDPKIKSELYDIIRSRVDKFMNGIELTTVPWIVEIDPGRVKCYNTIQVLHSDRKCISHVPFVLMFYPNGEFAAQMRSEGNQFNEIVSQYLFKKIADVNSADFNYRN